jgi:hypothetical protein
MLLFSIIIFLIIAKVKTMFERVLAWKHVDSMQLLDMHTMHEPGNLDIAVELRLKRIYNVKSLHDSLHQVLQQATLGPFHVDLHSLNISGKYFLLCFY